MRERRGKEVAGGDEEQSLAGCHLAAGSRKMKLTFERSVFCFSDDNAFPTAGGATEGLLCFWASGNKTTKSNYGQGRKRRKR
jgi:hypothetical protein